MIKNILKFIGVIFLISCVVFLIYIADAPLFYGRPIEEVLVDRVFIIKYTQTMVGILIMATWLIVWQQKRYEIIKERTEEKQAQITKNLLEENKALKDLAHRLGVPKEFLYGGKMLERLGTFDDGGNFKAYQESKLQEEFKEIQKYIEKQKQQGQDKNTKN